MQHYAEGGHSPGVLPAPQGAWDLWGPPLPSTPLPHQFHQHRLRLKKHISSYDICCICLFVTVGVSYVMAVLLSCLIYLALVPLWSITSVTICTYPWPWEAEPCTGMHAHVLHRLGCRVQEPIQLPARSPGASSTHRCPLHRGAQCPITQHTCVCLSLTHCSSTLMTLLTTVCLSLTEPWVPCVPRAQHTLRFQVWLQGTEHPARPGGGYRTLLQTQAQSRGAAPHNDALRELVPPCTYMHAWGGSVTAHTPLSIPSWCWMHR